LCVCVFLCVYTSIDLPWIPRASSCESVRSADAPPFRLGIQWVCYLESQPHAPLAQLPQPLTSAALQPTSRTIPETETMPLCGNMSGLRASCIVQHIRTSTHLPAAYRFQDTAAQGAHDDESLQESTACAARDRCARMVLVPHAPALTRHPAP
jgi:hypothetical protein